MIAVNNSLVIGQSKVDYKVLKVIGAHPPPFTYFTDYSL